MARQQAADPLVAAAEAAVASDTTKAESSLGLKLAQIMLEVGASMPEPEGNNEHFRYRYYKDTQLMSMFRQRLAQRGIIIVPEVLEVNIREGKTARGGSTWLTTLKVQYAIWDGHTKEMIMGTGVGQGDDPGDKGANKAMTGAFKFFLMKLFMVGGEADPEADERTDERAIGESRGRRRRDDDDDRPRRSSGGGYSDYDNDYDDDPVVIGDSNIEGIQRGGRANKATEAQLRQVRELARDLDWKPDDVVRECIRLQLDELELDEDPAEQGPQLVRYLESLRSTEIGELIDEMKRLVERRREHVDE